MQGEERSAFRRLKLHRISNNCRRHGAHVNQQRDAVGGKDREKVLDGPRQMADRQYLAAVDLNWNNNRNQAIFFLTIRCLRIRSANPTRRVRMRFRGRSANWMPLSVSKNPPPGQPVRL